MFFFFVFLGESSDKHSIILYILRGMETIGCKLGIALGYLFGHARRQDPLVQHYKFAGSGLLFIW